MYLVVNSGRMVQKIVTASGQAFTVAPSNDHTDGSWGIGSLYDGEFGINSANAALWLRISGTVYQISLSGSTGAALPTGTSAQTLRYDSGGVLVANNILKNDGTDVFVGAGAAGTGSLFSTVNSLTDHNIIVKNLNAGGAGYIEFQNNAGVEKFDVGLNGTSFIIQNAAATGIIYMDANGIVTVQQNSAGIHQILILQNLNSSAPVYLTFLNAAGAEKFYAGYRQAQTRFDILSADNTVGLCVDNNGRTLIGIDNSVYVAPDSAYVLTVETRNGIGSNGMVLRNGSGSGGAPIGFKAFDASGTFVTYAVITPTVLANTFGAYTGKINFDVAVAGSLVTKMVIDPSGITTGVWLATTIAVAKGGTGKTSIAANKMLVALTTDTYSETPYFDVAEQAIASTITFIAGTPPATVINNVYRWSQVGNCVDVQFNLNYTTAGVTVTGLAIAKPADMPDPAQPTSFTGASAIICWGAGTSQTSLTAISGNHKAYLKRNAANNGYEFCLDSPSGSTKVFWIAIRYFTT